MGILPSRVYGALPVTTLLPESERDISWLEFCERYADATGRQVTLRKQFRRLCRIDRLAELSEETLRQFADAMLDDGLHRDDLRRRLPNFRHAIKWGFDAGLIDPSRFDVQLVPSPRNVAKELPALHWQWRARDGRINYRRLSQGVVA
jgi:hypothetical protein